MKKIINQIWLRVHILLPKDNERLKILFLCFLTAMIFWFFRALNKTYTTDLQYPVEFVYNAPDSFSIVHPLPEYIDVELKGGGWVLLTRAMEYSSAPIKITLANPTQSKRILTSSLRTTFRNYFQDVEFLSASPDSFSIDIEKKVQKKVKLYLEPNKISLAPNYKLFGTPILVPDSATFTGPLSYIESISDSVEVSLPLQGIDQNIMEEIDLESFRSKLIDVKPNQISAKGKVVKVIKTRRKIYAHLTNFPKNWSVIDSTCWINYSIEEPFNNNMADMDFDVVVDFNKMRNDSTIIPELVKFPAIVESIVLDSIPLRVCLRKKKTPFL